MEEEATAMTPEEEEVLPTFTLAEFSSRGLKRKLERTRTRTRTRTRRTKGVCLPLPTLTKREIEEPGSKAVGVCGARAKVKAGRRGEEEKQHEEQACDVEWEDIGDEGGEDLGGGREDDEEDAIDLTGGDGDEVDVSVEVESHDPLADASFARAWAVLVHRSHALCLLARGDHLDRAAGCPLLQGLVVSLVPSRLAPPPQRLRAKSLADLLRFFHRHLAPTVAASAEEVGLREGLLRAMGAGEEGGGGCPEGGVAVLLAALLRGLGHRCRVVTCVCPAPKTPKRAVQEYRSRLSRAEADEKAEATADDDDDDEVVVVVETKGRRGRGAKKGGGREYGEWNAVVTRRGVQGVPRGDGAGEGPPPSPSSSAWVEVFLSDAWVSADPGTGSVGSAGSYLGQERGLCVAVEAGRRKDVTRRYAKMFHRRKREVDWGWWEETMATVAAMGGWGAEARCDDDAGREEAELEAKAEEEAKADWPKTLGQAKQHPVYVLRRHLRRNQCLVAAPTFLGKFVGGEPLFLRREVQDLRSAKGWERVGRKVVEGEAGRPRVPEEAAGSDAGRGGEASSGPAKASSGPAKAKPALYSEDQTEAWRCEEVPSRSVLCPPLVQKLPDGLVHLPDATPKVMLALKAEGVVGEFALAVVGFARRGGRSVPEHRGVVCRQRDARQARHAHLELEFKLAEEARRKRLRQAAAGWRRVLGLLVKRRELRGRYLNGEKAKAGVGGAACRETPAMTMATAEVEEL